MLILCSDWPLGPVFRASNNLWNGCDWWHNTLNLFCLPVNQFPQSLSKKKYLPGWFKRTGWTRVVLAIGQRKIKSIARKRDSEMTRRGQLGWLVRFLAGSWRNTAGWFVWEKNTIPTKNLRLFRISHSQTGWGKIARVWNQKLVTAAGSSPSAGPVRDFWR